MANTYTFDVTVSVKVRDQNGNLVQPFTFNDVQVGVGNHIGAGQVQVPGGSINFPVPFGTTAKGHIIGLIFSRRATLKFDIGDSGVAVGPGIFLLQSSDAGVAGIFLTTAVGEDVCIQTLIGGEV